MPQADRDASALLTVNAGSSTNPICCSPFSASSAPIFFSCSAVIKVSSGLWLTGFTEQATAPRNRGNRSENPSRGFRTVLTMLPHEMVVQKRHRPLSAAHSSIGDVLNIGDAIKWKDYY